MNFVDLIITLSYAYCYETFKSEVFCIQTCLKVWSLSGLCRMSKTRTKEPQCSCFICKLNFQEQRENTPRIQNTQPYIEDDHWRN